MAVANLRSEERIGLIAAIAIHAALLALLVLHPGARQITPPPERMSVTLSDDVGLTSTSPEPQAAPAPEAAPVLGEVPEPPPQPVAKPAPVPLPPQPRLVEQPRPVAAPAPRPQPRPQPRVAQPAPARPTPPATRPAGARRIGSDFLKGIPDAPASGAARNPPAAAIGPAVQSSLASAISRQLKPHWAAPQGADAEKLVTILAWDLNEDGSLASGPRVVRQDGITDANRPQASRHAEQAMRAVRLAAPFDLPSEYYDAWKRVGSFRFDKRLSQ